MKKNKGLIVTIIVLIILLGIAITISQFFEDFNKTSLRKNNKTIFSSTDLIVSSLGYGATENEIKKKLKEPISEKNFTENAYEYKSLEYKGLTLTLKENYEDFILVKAEITSSKYSISRKIQVGDRILNTVNKFKVSNKTGNYIYGNNTIDSLETNETTEQIYFGVRNDKSVMYVNRDTIIDGQDAYISKLIIDYEHGKVKKITWSYDIK